MSSSVPAVRVPRWLWLGALASATGGLLSLLVSPSALINDPNSWLLWAGELPSGTISLAGQGNVSWKPLPVLLSVPFTAISAQTGIWVWLWISRSCVIATSLLLYRLASRRGGPFGGVVAALLPLLILTWDQAMVGGASEPLLMVLIFGAVEAGLADRRRLALALGLAAGLIRPEVTPLLAIWGVWMLREEGRSAIPPLAIGVAVLAVGWFALPWLLMGDALQAARTTTEFPRATPGVGDMFRIALGWTTTFWWTLAPLAIGVWVAVREHDRLLTCLIAGSAIWTLTLLVLGAGGVAGMPRYTVPPMVALCAVTGAGAGALVLWARPAAAQVVVGLVIAGALGWSLGDHFERIGAFFDLGHEQLLAVDRAEAAVIAAGGVERFRNCQPLQTNAYLGYPGALGPRLGLDVRGKLRPASAPTVLVVGDLSGLSRNAAGAPPAGIEGETGRRLLARRGAWSVYEVSAGARGCIGASR